MNVKSSDPMKAKFIAAIRAACPDVSKVTDVTLHRGGILRGRALQYVPGKRRSYRYLGDVEAVIVGDGFNVIMHPAASS